MNKTSGKMSSLLDVLDTVFVVNGEMIEDCGEDSFAYSVNDGTGFVGVFDGCGGIGSRKYTEYNNKSGAYIASRVAASVTLDWFKRHGSRGIELTAENVAAMSENLKNSLAHQLKSMETGTETSILRGSLAKSFPTTASLFLFSAYKNEVHASFIWAGDSRGYVMTTSGLCQITNDDIEGGNDALVNLSADGKLTNLVYADDAFTLHRRNVVCDDAAIFITATDGCFGYFSTPMEFEYMLLETMQHADTPEQWKHNITQYIKKYTADDYTIGFAVCGYKSFTKMKKQFLPRKLYLQENYISKLATGETAIKEALWDEYKKTYYRGV